MKKIYLATSRSGLPCYWEHGGSASNTGDAEIVAGRKGEAKKAIYIRKKGTLSNAFHALIPVREGDYIIRAKHWRGDFEIEIWKIISISKELDIIKEGAARCLGGLDDWAEPGEYERHVATIELLYKFENGEWDKPLAAELEASVKAAKNKATAYHCRRPYYIQEPV